MDVLRSIKHKHLRSVIKKLLEDGWVAEPIKHGFRLRSPYTKKSIVIHRNIDKETSVNNMIATIVKVSGVKY